MYYFDIQESNNVADTHTLIIRQEILSKGYRYTLDELIIIHNMMNDFLQDSPELHPPDFCEITEGFDNKCCLILKNDIETLGWYMTRGELRSLKCLINNYVQSKGIDI